MNRPNHRDIILNTLDSHDETILTRTFQMLQTTNAFIRVTNLIDDPRAANVDAQYDEVLLAANIHDM